MQLDARKYLFDIQQEVQLLDEFTDGVSFPNYQANALLRSAVERQFEIVGEAMSRLASLDSQVAEHITDHRRIIAFRNILIHGYAEVDNRIVWGVLTGNLPQLRAEVDALLGVGEGE